MAYPTLSLLEMSDQKPETFTFTILSRTKDHWSLQDFAAYWSNSIQGELRLW